MLVAVKGMHAWSLTSSYATQKQSMEGSDERNDITGCLMLRMLGLAAR
jgi:hypothetical protein